MRRVTMRLASEADDAELRRLLRETPIKGAIQMRFLREPSFFQAARVEGEASVAIVGESTEDGRIVALGARAEKNVYINGKPECVGYLSGLRGEPSVRNGTLLGQGFRILRDLHNNGNVRFYLTTIIEDNLLAQRILTSARGGLPAYRDIGRLHTFCIAHNPRKRIHQWDCEVRAAQNEDLPAVVEFLQRYGPCRQFYPAYTLKDLRGETGLLQGLETNDILLACKGNEILGTIAIWDQHAFKQCLVADYQGLMHYGRHVLNALARMSCKPQLPQPGSDMKYATLALVCVKENNSETFHTLLHHAVRVYTKDNKGAFVTLGLHEEDPLLPVAKAWPYFDYRSRVYVVHWEDGAAEFEALDSRPPYLELGAL